MTRRSFLNRLGLLAAVAQVDPDRLLWVPRKKTIFIPPQSILNATGDLALFKVGDIISFGSDGRWYRVMAVAPALSTIQLMRR